MAPLDHAVVAAVDGDLGSGGDGGEDGSGDGAEHGRDSGRCIKDSESLVGCLQRLGTAWEWTTSQFLPYATKTQKQKHVRHE